MKHEETRIQQGLLAEKNAHQGLLVAVGERTTPFNSNILQASVPANEEEHTTTIT